MKVPLFPSGSSGFEAFLRESGPALLRLGHLLTLDRAAAEDLAQETYIRLGLAWSRVRRDGNPVGYARRTMLNLFLNSRRRPPPTPVPVVPEPARDDPALAAVDSAAVIGQILAGLPPQQRAALALRYLDDLPDAEIGALLGCSPATVRSHLSRGLSTLRSRRSPLETTQMEGEPDARRP
ncbi:sigma-70 family RNA polymerase sigma factor [Actinoplanes sp. LDG1-06]|uniref:Sigma-70 family RNA polymerase sigma factor n=1 Tax=Paractinoplanes ovalisporus TaxID=2810368 RepID=A0ABS2A834_9ACTN|nr:sigma-70 family RNA polymerase sigma factor [Actinoplanes ovalisporus]MBM2615439.1 sigma-70 family RNA polymerase sigma factor [Actinoplanes ovalisporus]